MKPSKLLLLIQVQQSPAPILDQQPLAHLLHPKLHKINQVLQINQTYQVPHPHLLQIQIILHQQIQVKVQNQAWIRPSWATCWLRLSSPSLWQQMCSSLLAFPSAQYIACSSLHRTDFKTTPQGSSCSAPSLVKAALSVVGYWGKSKTKTCPASYFSPWLFVLQLYYPTRSIKSGKKGATSVMNSTLAVRESFTTSF